MAWIPLPRNVGGTDQEVHLPLTFPLAIANNCLSPVYINMSLKQIENKVSKNCISGKTKAQIRNMRSFASGG